MPLAMACAMREAAEAPRDEKFTYCFLARLIIIDLSREQREHDVISFSISPRYPRARRAKAKSIHASACFAAFGRLSPAAYITPALDDDTLLFHHASPPKSRELQSGPQINFIFLSHRPSRRDADHNALAHSFEYEMMQALQNTIYLILLVSFRRGESRMSSRYHHSLLTPQAGGFWLRGARIGRARHA